MHVCLRLSRHIEIDDKINPFNINTSSENVRGNHNPFVILLEFIIIVNSCILGQAFVHANIVEAFQYQVFGQSFCSFDLVDEYDHLIEGNCAQNVD